MLCHRIQSVKEQSALLLIHVVLSIVAVAPLQVVGFSHTPLSTFDSIRGNLPNTHRPLSLLCR